MNIGKLSREELIVLAHRLLTVTNEEESIKLYEEFNRQFSHPDAANLLFYPENYNANQVDIENYSPSVEIVIDLALAHMPTSL